MGQSLHSTSAKPPSRIKCAATILKRSSNSLELMAEELTARLGEIARLEQENREIASASSMKP